MSGVLLAGEERRRFEGALVPFRRCFGAGKKVFWCRQSIALVPGLLEGGESWTIRTKDRAFFVRLGSELVGWWGDFAG
jgi:hypothetical protein